MKTIQGAYSLSNRIRKEYDKLSTKNRIFFETYHDNLMYQLQGVDEELDEMLVDFDNQNEEHFMMGYKNLEDTLVYFKAVIKLQKLTLELPESIYG